jgi:protein involved in polysaccharide export with SLBB domain
MPQSSILAGGTRNNSKARLRTHVACLRSARVAMRITVLAFGLLSALSSAARAQEPFAPPPGQSTSSTSTSTDSLSPSSTITPTDDSNSQQSQIFGSAQDATSSAQDATQEPSTFAGGNALSGQASLSSGQIIQILQQNPDLVVEIKSQVADHLQQQGTQVDANDISDEMLYNQIATNADVRANVTTYLRARGYVSSSGLQTSDSSGAGRSTSSEMSSADGSVSGNRDTSAGQLGAGTALDSGQFPMNADGSQSSSASSTSGVRQQQNRGREETNASTDIPKILRRPAPYNLQSMRDLYTQFPQQSAPLKRFGSEVFVNRGMSAMGAGTTSRDTPLDVPLGPDYVLGVGDTLTINLWGGVTQSINRQIDRDGHILLPEAGSLQVAGLPLKQAEDLITGALKQQFRNAQVSVTVSRLRSVRVYLVGDVQRPGGYDISSLATPLGALYAAGGPTSVGSLRVVRHYRGQQLIEEVDLYDFLLHGVRNTSARFEAGDTLLVPPAGPQVAISGAIKRPAIYELKAGESTLSSVINDAGGVTAAASLGHITIERIDANRQRETVSLSLPSEQGPTPTSAAGQEPASTGATGQSLASTNAAIDSFQVKDGDRIHIAPILPYSERAIYLQGHVVRPGRLPYNDGMRLSDVLHSYRDMLPEPAEHGEIIRLVPPDLHAETIGFEVPDVLIGNGNVNLQPFDTIRIFGRYQVDTPKVAIHGEVLQPGSYPMSKGMTAAQLVRMAGGFKRDALVESADLTSYDVVNGNRVAGALATVHIGAAVDGKDANADVPLKPGDILTIHQITGWNDIGESITINGQVRFPGSYGFQEGERLSSVLRRAGGIRDTAYPEGAVMIRDQVRELEEKSRDELIRQIETNSASARLSPAAGGGASGGTAQLIAAQQNQAISQLKSNSPSGRMVVHISADIDSWANTTADIELRRGDVLTIPKRPGFVLVSGQVYNPTALTFSPGKTAAWYLSRAGGTNATANRKDVFIIRANGSVIGRHSEGFFDPKVLSIKLNPGDVIVVPQKIFGTSLFWRNLLITAQLASGIGLTAGIAAAAL